MTSKTRIK